MAEHAPDEHEGEEIGAEKAGRLPFHLDGRSAADRSPIELAQRRDERGVGHTRVGIDEDEIRTRRDRGAGVAHRGDLPLLDALDPGPEARGDLGGAVGRRVVHHDELTPSTRPGGAIHGDLVEKGSHVREGRRELALLVPGRNDDRDVGHEVRSSVAKGRGFD